MNVFLINPPFKPECGRFSREQRSPAITKSGTLYYPFWLCYAAGAINQSKRHFAELIDAPAQRRSIATILDGVRMKNPGLVLVNTSTPSISSDLEFVASLRRAAPNSKIAVVGTHPSALPEETLRRCPELDFVIRREYDRTVVELADALEEGRPLTFVRGLAFLQTGKFVSTPDQVPIEDLDSLPMLPEIYSKYLQVEDYFFAAARYPMIMLITGRGCPNGCTYCVYPQTFHSRHYRFASAERVVEEIKCSRKLFPQVREIVFEDDTFTANKERCLRICEGLLREGDPLPWTVNTRVSVDLETMQLMKRAGCRLLVVGFESGDPEILRNIHKGATLEQADSFMRNAKKCGLLVHGCFMVGNMGETRATMQKTLDMAKRLNPDTAQFFPLMVYPGTEAYGWAKQENRLVTEDFSEWVTSAGLHNCVIRTADMTSDELVRFCDDARRKFYLRPGYIAGKLWQVVRSHEERKRILKAFVRFCRYLWS